MLGYSEPPAFTRAFRRWNKENLRHFASANAIVSGCRDGRIWDCLTARRATARRDTRGSYLRRPAKPKRRASCRPVPFRTCFLRRTPPTTASQNTCWQVRLERRRVYDWKAHDPDFTTALADAEVEALERLRGAAHKRALTRSDSMLMFLLKRLRPEVFGRSRASPAPDAGSGHEDYGHRHSG